MKQNQTFFHRTHSNLTSIFLVKKYVFQWSLKSKSLIFMTKVSAQKGSETKSDILLLDTLESGMIVHRLQNLKIFQWLFKLPSHNIFGKRDHKQRKQNKIFHETCSNFTLAFLGHIFKYSLIFKIYFLATFIINISIIKGNIRGEMLVVKSCSFNFERNRTHLRKKTRQPWAKIFFIIPKKYFKITSQYAARAWYVIQSFSF